MEGLYPAILFTVRIQQDPAWGLLGSRDSHLALESHRTTWIPGFDSAKNIAKNNGEQFTLYGVEAIYYKILIDSGQCKDLIYEIVGSNATPPVPTGGTPINAPAINATAINGSLN